MPGKSFAEWLVKLGFDTYIIDWGTPSDEDRYLSFDEICDRYLGRALRATTRKAQSEQAHVLGYCMGGTLAAIHAAVRPERVASLCALAAPIRFEDDGLLSAWTRARGFDVDALVGGFGNVPWRLMQGAFHLLRPTMNLSKAVHVIDRAWDDEFLDGFLALETWGNDNVSFPGECYRKYIEELWQQDALNRRQVVAIGSPGAAWTASRALCCASLSSTTTSCLTRAPACCWTEYRQQTSAPALARGARGRRRQQEGEEDAMAAVGNVLGRAG